MGEKVKVKCSFDDCSNAGVYIVSGRTEASGEIKALICVSCLPRLSRHQNVSMGTKPQPA